MGMIMKDGIPYGGIYPIDDAPTQGSNNAVKSGGVHSALSNKVDKVAGKGLSTNDYDNTEKGKVSDNASAIEAMVNVCGSKNLANYVGVNTTKTLPPYTNIEYGLTFTFNADASITVSGVATGTGDAWGGFLMAYKLNAGRYAISCTASAAYDTSKFFGVDNMQWGSVIDGRDHIREITGGDLAIIFHIETGADFSTPVTFYPMIRDARIKDTTWVPSAMTNKELTERIAYKFITLTPTSAGSDLYEYISHPDSRTPKFIVAQCIAPSENANANLRLWWQAFETGQYQSLLRYVASNANLTYTVALCYFY